MSFRYERKKAIQVILFLLHSLGKRADPLKLFSLLYLADLKHLAKYGLLITGDIYIAMKNGPAPFHILSIYQQLRQDSITKSSDYKKELIYAHNDEQLVALVNYNTKHLSESEVECLFETLQEHKSKSLKLLSVAVTKQGWKNADVNGNIYLADMAIEAGATAEMMRYIEISYKNERLF